MKEAVARFNSSQTGPITDCSGLFDLERKVKDAVNKFSGNIIESDLLMIYDDTSDYNLDDQRRHMNFDRRFDIPGPTRLTNISVFYTTDKRGYDLKVCHVTFFL